jgi:hypothetical protein
MGTPVTLITRCSASDAWRWSFSASRIGLALAQRMMAGKRGTPVVEEDVPPRRPLRPPPRPAGTAPTPFFRSAATDFAQGDLVVSSWTCSGVQDVGSSVSQKRLSLQAPSRAGPKQSVPAASERNARLAGVAKGCGSSVAKPLGSASGVAQS